MQGQLASLPSSADLLHRHGRRARARRRRREVVQTADDTLATTDLRAAGETPLALGRYRNALCGLKAI